MNPLRSQNSYYHDKDDPEFQRLVHQGGLFELQRFKVSEQFPASDELAIIHKRANMFGIREPHENRVCPCCSQRIKHSHFSVVGTSMDDSFLSSDIVLLFAFIRMLIYYYLLRFLISDLYNLWTSYVGRVCDNKIRCVDSFYHRLTMVNKMDQPYQVFMVDILNLVFVGFSIFYFTLYQLYLHKWFVQMSISIQTEDDYTLFVTNIPIAAEMDANNEVHYAEVVRQYCQNQVVEWLRNPSKSAEVYGDYVKVAMNHGHHPSNPPNIIAKVNLCWDLHEIKTISKQKEQLQRDYEKFKQNEDKDKGKGKERGNRDRDGDDEDVIYDDEVTMKQLEILSRTEIELCQQFELNQYYGFVVSKFLGKAFVSFEYQHFSRVVYESIREAQPYNNHYLKADFAQPPRDIYWQNLGITKWQKFQKLLTTFFICAGLLLITFLILFGIKYQQKKYYLRSAAHTPLYIKIFLRVGLSLFTIGVSTLLRIAIRRLAKYEQHDTKTNQNIAVMYKSVIAIICNQIVNPFAVNLLLGNLIWRSNGLTSQIINLLTISIVLNLVRSIINPRNIWKWIQFKWNYWNAPPILRFQENYNEEVAHNRFEVYEKYMFYVNQLFLISFFAYLVPFGSLMGVGFYIARYTIDRVILLRFSSFHPRYSYDLTQRAVNLAATSILVFAIGNYLNQWLYFGKWLQPVNLISLALASIYTALIWTERAKKIFTKSHTFYDKFSYTDCVNKDNFFHTYNSLNPATKLANYGRNHIEYIGVNRAPQHFYSRPQSRLNQLQF